MQESMFKNLRTDCKYGSYLCIKIFSKWNTLSVSSSGFLAEFMYFIQMLCVYLQKLYAKELYKKTRYKNFEC